MAFLDTIKEGLASLESGMKDTAREATTTSGLRGSAVRKEKMKDWSRSKEGVALIDVALSVGLSATAAATSSANAAENFILDAYEKKDELMDLGRKLVDKKSYEAGEKALDLKYEVEKFVEDNNKTFGKAVKSLSMSTAEKMRAAQPDTGPSFLDTMKEAKESSVEFTSKLVKEVSANAETFKKELSEKHDVKVSAIDMMLEKSGNDVSQVVSDIADLANKTAAELTAMGITKIEGYTRRDGGKVPTHFRKRAR